MSALQNKGDCKLKGGVRVGGEKYFMVNFDEEKNIMYLKKSGGGAAAALSNTGVVFASYDISKTCTTTKDGETTSTNQNGPNVNLGVQNLQDFLLNNSL